MKLFRSRAQYFALSMLLITAGSWAVSWTSLGPSKSTMFFGNVLLGSSTQVTEFFWNPTSSPITIASASIEGTDFSLMTSFPLTVPPRERVPVVVAYSPAALGNSSGTLTILMDGTPSSLTVPTYGTGVAPGRLMGAPSSINFSSGAPGQHVMETVTNVGSTSVLLQSATTTGTGFWVAGFSYPILLRPGQSLPLTVTTTGSSAAGSGSLNLAAVARAWTPGERGAYKQAFPSGSSISLLIPVTIASTAAGRLTAAPSWLSFGSTQVGSTRNLPATLTNAGTADLTVTQATASGAGFSISGLPLPLTLPAGGSVTFSAIFTPTSAGSALGQIAVTSSGSNASLALPLSAFASAPGQLALSPPNLNFGTIAVGKTQQLTASLTASGSSVTVSNASASSSEFLLSGIQLPVTIPAGQSASFTVTFAPLSSGTASANISFGTSGSAGVVESLTGAGATGAPHSVALSWTAGGAGVTAYNVYRGLQTGGPYSKLNSSSSSANTYTDGSVTSGQSYFYVTTALDSAGAESAHSNEVQATIP